jgi:hypothetical protein
VREGFDHVTYSTVVPDHRQQSGASRRFQQKGVGSAGAATPKSVGQ